MYLENIRDLLRGIVIIVFAAIAYWINLTLGLAVVAIMGVLILLSAFTDWCPADIFLKRMGLQTKRQNKG